MSTEAQKRASTNYNRKQDNIMVRPTKEEGAAIRAAAASVGQSVQAYILQANRDHVVWVNAWSGNRHRRGAVLVFLPPVQKKNICSRSV